MKEILFLILKVLGFYLILAGVYCDQEKLEVDHFPLMLGNRWSYKYRVEETVIDSMADTSYTLNYEGQCLFRIDTLEIKEGWQCYRLKGELYFNGDTLQATLWLAHPDTALLEIATLLGEWKPSLIESSIRKGAPSLPLLSDSGKTPKKLYIFPLSLGKRWRVSEEEEREVVDSAQTKVPAGDFSTFEIETISERGGEHKIWLGKIGLVKESSVDTLKIETDMGTSTHIKRWTYELEDYSIGE